MRKYRRIKARPGELKVYYGKLPHDDPDVVYAWGEGVSICDANLANFVLSAQRIKLIYGEERDKAGSSYVFEKSFLEELIERGYDITTLKFSIQRIKQTNQVT